MWLCVPLCFRPPFVKLGLLCGFILGQKCSSWYCTVVGMRGLGEGPVWYKKGPCPLSLFVATDIGGEWGGGGSGRGQVNVLSQIIV